LRSLDVKRAFPLPIIHCSSTVPLQFPLSSGFPFHFLCLSNFPFPSRSSHDSAKRREPA
ncbi:unnamed protein product, partial [Citrullus colocynthis]